ncbi:MAG: ATP phosphoribosyltransferase regulatory subunit, partial [Rickettsiales bacterium]|nr:ATP phosphoribosyltransferase regulatory subunit [Rickettsiales bacterium]
MKKFRHVVDTAKKMSSLYGFKECATPIFEFTEVFKRTLGDTSDIVSKEMYCFEDRGGESLTLRPEFTAAVVRSVISNGLTQDLPCKFFSAGPIFRYERPQKGRFRQFHQVNFELIGTQSYLADIEVIALGHSLLKQLGITDHITLEINSLGDKESRER